MTPLFGSVSEPGLLETLLILVVMVGLPLALFAPFAKVGYDLWRGETPRVRAGNAPVSDKWWVLVAVSPIWFLCLIVLALLSMATGSAMFSDIISRMFLVSLLLLALCPVAVHFDRKYVAAVADWRPSVAYYLTFASIVGVLLAAMYVYERHERVGVP